MGLVGKAGRDGDLGQGKPPLQDQIPGMLDTALDQETVRRAAERRLEGAGEVERADMGDRGEIN